MIEGVLERVALNRLGQGQRLGAVGQCDVEDLVDAAMADRGGELARGKGDVFRGLAMPVQHGGHLAGTAGPAGATFAELGASVGADLYLGHGSTPARTYSLVGGARARGCVDVSPNTAPITAPSPCLLHRRCPRRGNTDSL